MIRLLFAVTISVSISLFGTRYLIRWLTSKKIGQPIREDGPGGHITKAGTPTMGGIAVVMGGTIAYVISDLYNGIYTRSGLLVMAAILGASIVGFLDDWLKVSNERNLGLKKGTKVVGLLIVAFGFAIAMVTSTSVHTEVSFTRWDSLSIDLGPVGWVFWAVFVILAMSNAVNLTDGLDGLAAGSSTLCFSALTVVSFWAFRHPEIYDLDHALDLAVVAVSMLGACVGFLWWNAAPAKIFMGDTGSLAIGTALACLALATNTHLLLPIIGGIFVLETLSVIIQVLGFRLMNRRRIFRMAPFHHHFELLGWPETTVIVRFWIIGGFFVAIALGLFYADFVEVSDLRGAVLP
ncbi:MAG: phospho-N-acetylmuramoyl-pentapeptide-transferase [Actinomycetota bacterium]|nr:phospho-N-acetylmuramoyl-pentapeptide-transferase [Actinomycetota bacterium]